VPTIKYEKESLTSREKLQLHARGGRVRSIFHSVEFL